MVEHALTVASDEYNGTEYKVPKDESVFIPLYVAD